MRSLLCAFLLLLSSALSAEEHVRLSTLPEHVYRVDDDSKMQTESWYFELVTHDPADRKWQPEALKVELMSSGKVVRSSTWSAAALNSMRRRNYFPTADMPKLSLRRHFSIPDEVFTIPLMFSERRADAIDRLRVTMMLSLEKARLERSIVVPIERYEQKTKLIFPFKGPGIVTQGNFNNGGHNHRQTLFAIDVMATTPTFAPMTSEEERNDTTAGWGKDIIAPAAGTVVYARNDVPVNVLYETPELSAYEVLPEPIWAIAGNCVVIDHGNGEYSSMMHMQTGSVTVKKGDTVKQGQTLGKLGNTGDSNMPHLHYQLTDGPTIFASDGLPVKFENLPGKVLTRGTYFTAK